MRIISGSARGISIEVPKTITRPTTTRVRESLFSSLGTFLIEAKVLDLFAGSGALGLESLSRGSASSVFVENSSAACDCILKNLIKTSLADRGQVRQQSVSRFLRGNSAQYDIILADPPYARDEVSEAFICEFLSDPRLRSALSPDGLLIIEFQARSPLPDLDEWIVEKTKTYGDTGLSFLRTNSVLV